MCHSNDALPCIFKCVTILLSDFLYMHRLCSDNYSVSTVRSLHFIKALVPTVRWTGPNDLNGPI